MRCSKIRASYARRWSSGWSGRPPRSSVGAAASRNSVHDSGVWHELPLRPRLRSLDRYHTRFRGALGPRPGVSNFYLEWGTCLRCWSISGPLNSLRCSPPGSQSLSTTRSCSNSAWRPPRGSSDWVSVVLTPFAAAVSRPRSGHSALAIRGNIPFGRVAPFHSRAPVPRPGPGRPPIHPTRIPGRKWRRAVAESPRQPLSRVG